jgi:uncharacterized HhH-GPD family protein
VTAEGSRAAVGLELASWGECLAREGVAQVGGAFTDVPEADEFLRSRPEAFLIGVLFTQGIPAERAWAGPYLLSQRLGHFDLDRIANERDSVAEALARPPALHRFVRTLPGWISDAAARIGECYGGDAAAVWEGEPTAVELMERLSGFRGIGRKKAAMAAVLLSRYFGVPVREPEGGTVAYDTHVRRVFLRSGLVDIDTPAEIERAAAAACPEAPGLLDLPAWLIGRQWCRPVHPECDECRLAGVCPRLTDRSVEGVGARPCAGPRARRVPRSGLAPKHPG